MLHRLRSVLVRPGHEYRLSGTVEVDEIYFGGAEAGLTGGRAKGKKVLVGVAVERKEHEHKGFGRCRMVVLPDTSAASLHAFIEAHVETGATIVTDGWTGYYGIEKLGYVHDRHSPARRGCSWRRHQRTASGRAPSGIVGQALAPRYASGQVR